MSEPIKLFTDEQAEGIRRAFAGFSAEMRAQAEAVNAALAAVDASMRRQLPPLIEALGARMRTDETEKP